jgi:hypothetical protein
MKSLRKSEQQNTQSRRIVDDVIPANNPPFFDLRSNSQASLLFFLSSLLSNFSYLHTCKIRSFLNKCFAVVKMRPVRQISLDLQGSRPFLRPQLGSQPCQAPEPWWGWGIKGAWRGSYFNCPVLKYMPPFFFCLFCQMLLALQRRENIRSIL